MMRGMRSTSSRPFESRAVTPFLAASVPFRMVLPTARRVSDPSDGHVAPRRFDRFLYADANLWCVHRPKAREDASTRARRAVL